jgi:RNA polymerase-binding transcription factor DksA
MATQKHSKSSKATASKGKPSKAAPVKKSAPKVQPKGKPVAKSASPVKAKSKGKAVQASKAKKAAPVAKKKTPVAKKPVQVKKAAPVAKKAAPVAKKPVPKPIIKKPSLVKAVSVKPKAAPVSQAKNIQSPSPVAKATTKEVTKPVSKVVAPVKPVPAPLKSAVKTSNQPVSLSTGKLDAKPVGTVKPDESIKPVLKTIPEKPVPTPAKPESKLTGSKSSDLAKPSVSSKPMVEKPKEEQPKSKGFQRKSLKQNTAHAVKPFDIMSDKKEIKPAATMYSDEPHKTRYNDKELEEFDQLIDQKLIVAREQLEFYLKQLEDMAENPDNKIKGLDDGLSTLESERVSSMAARQQKLIQHLENAKIRIKNKVYGICRETGRLISKERLRAVPHATLSIEAKQAQN